MGNEWVHVDFWSASRPTAYPKVYGDVMFQTLVKIGAAQRIQRGNSNVLNATCFQPQTLVMPKVVQLEAPSEPWWRRKTWGLFVGSFSWGAVSHD